MYRMCCWYIITGNVIFSVAPFAPLLKYTCYMMTSWNGNIFRVTGHLAGNSPVSGEFPAQRPVTRSFDIFFDLRLNKRLSKPSWGWWFETLSCPLWRQCNDMGNRQGAHKSHRISSSLCFHDNALLYVRVFILYVDMTMMYIILCLMGRDKATLNLESWNIKFWISNPQNPQLPCCLRHAYHQWDLHRRHLYMQHIHNICDNRKNIPTI